MEVKLGDPVISSSCSCVIQMAPTVILLKYGRDSRHFTLSAVHYSWNPFMTCELSQELAWRLARTIEFNWVLYHPHTFLYNRRFYDLLLLDHDILSVVLNLPIPIQPLQEYCGSTDRSPLFFKLFSQFQIYQAKGSDSRRSNPDALEEILPCPATISESR